MSYTIEQLDEFWNRGGRDKLASDEIDALLMDAIGKASEIARLRAALEAIECDPGGYCLWCAGMPGHMLDCQRQSALGVII
jgi:hypothetical protein